MPALPFHTRALSFSAVGNIANRTRSPTILQTTLTHAHTVDPAAEKVPACYATTPICGEGCWATLSGAISRRLYAAACSIISCAAFTAALALSTAAAMSACPWPTVASRVSKTRSPAAARREVRADRGGRGEAWWIPP